MDTILLQETSYQAAHSKHYEGAMAQGNGYMHLRASFEEGLDCEPQDAQYMRLPANVTLEKPRHPRSKCGTYVPGVTGRHPLLNEEMVNLPNPLRVLPTLNGEALDMDLCHISGYQRTLNMADGLLSRVFLWHAPGGAEVECRYERFVSMLHRHFVAQRIVYSVRAGTAQLRVRLGIDEHVRTNGFQHFKSISKKATPQSVHLEATTDQNVMVWMESRATSTAGQWSCDAGDQVLCADLCAGEDLMLEKYTQITTSRDLRRDPLVPLPTWDKWLKAQRESWQRLWKQARVEVEGDDRAQQALDFAVYHMLRCGSAEDDRIAICAKGFSGEAYFGHFFWDTEIYLLPFFLYHFPEIGKNLTRFRVRTLPGAMANAAAAGYSGARYAWESSVTGEEQCPNWQYADHEVHVTADVAFGLWHTFCATDDLAFLREAAPVFLETARYWLDRLYEAPDGSLQLKGVMGPDEYICLCDNNAYTNFMVRYALEKTLSVMELLDLRDEALESRLRHAVSALCCPADRGGVIPQCDHFDGFQEPEFDRFWPDRSKRYGACVSQERNYRTKALKQADVLMLPYLFPSLMDQEQLDENLKYYLPLTTHDSSLSAVIHAILLCRLGRAEEAYTLFEKAMAIDLDPDGGGAAEGVHIANCGGIWQAAVLGFAGMNYAYESDFPAFTPVLPRRWKRLRFKINYMQQTIAVDIGMDGVAVGGMQHDRA